MLEVSSTSIDLEYGELGLTIGPTVQFVEVQTKHLLLLSPFQYYGQDSMY